MTKKIKTKGEESSDCFKRNEIGVCMYIYAVVVCTLFVFCFSCQQISSIQII